jgi:hypothetical protein
MLVRITCSNENVCLICQEKMYCFQGFFLKKKIYLEENKFDGFEADKKNKIKKEI